MAIQGCRNAIEELVVEEIKAQISRLSSAVKAKPSLDEVAAYALNRLPPMYATTRRGYIQQQKRAHTDMKQEIAQTISKGLIGVKKDSLKDNTPLPDSELEREERSLLKLQEILGISDLRWRDVPDAVEKALLEIKLKGAVAYSTYKSKALRDASTVSDYLKRHSEELTWKAKTSRPLVGDNIIQMTEMKEFASYMAPASWNFVNTLENLVASVAQRQISKLADNLSQRVTLEEVSAYALNRLPPMYATSESGLKYWRERARTELSSDILVTVRQGVITILKSPSRFLPPIPADRFSHEQELAIIELQDILQVTDLNWQNVAMVVQDALEQVLRGELVWVPRDRRKQLDLELPS
ncbi:Late competence development protein ComFB [Synechococcus sp. PCC 7502]|uniref:late competence development ComFB family protein n=1 Tax=Synechococcus sp. PCC 7502 TaxID=1173263 RepID=UPI00029F8D0D|nr:late competence development ComFB family protein [Synechococcus sp. PCC 7502]AFY72222.1 Late competence development protein ComFB [Synechococcus sp. PCC 7502]